MVGLGTVELPTKRLGTQSRDARIIVAQNYYEFTTVVRFEAFRPNDQIVGTS